MAKIIATIVGGALGALGLLGFFAPAVFGCHGSALISFIHLGLCAAVLYLIQRGGEGMALQSCVVAGLICLGLGLTGLIAGGPGESTLRGMPPDSRLLVLIPRVLELGRSDHVLHLCFGVGFGIAAVVALAENPLRLRK
jgi:hypothetical protein